MDRFDSMRLLARVIERGSFTMAAADLGLSRSTVTEAMQKLEARLGVRLLQRTTRHVVPTLDGEAYYRSCLPLLAGIEEAEGAFSHAQPRGELRIDVHGFMARTLLLPHLPDFLARYPDLTLFVGEGDRLVDLVREGIDCVIRAGEPADSELICRRLATLAEITCASPAYVAAHATPATPAELDGHQMVAFVSSRTGRILPLEFQVGGKLLQVTLPHRVSATGSSTTAELARLGFGLVQAPRYRFAEDLRRGTLIEVLPDHPPSPTPVCALYPQNRQLSLRVRVFLDWAAEVFARSPLLEARPFSNLPPPENPRLGQTAARRRSTWWVERPEFSCSLRPGTAWVRPPSVVGFLALFP